MITVFYAHTVYTPGKGNTEEQEEALLKIFSSIGTCFKVKEEQINAYCGLFSSGIGFVSHVGFSALFDVTGRKNCTI